MEGKSKGVFIVHARVRENTPRGKKIFGTSSGVLVPPEKSLGKPSGNLLQLSQVITLLNSHSHCERKGDNKWQKPLNMQRSGTEVDMETPSFNSVKVKGKKKTMR